MGKTAVLYRHQIRVKVRVSGRVRVAVPFGNFFAEMCGVLVFPATLFSLILFKNRLSGEV